MNTGNLHDASWVPLAQAAEILTSTPLNVLMYVKRGILTGKEEEGGWLIDSATLATLVDMRRNGVVPAVCKSGCAQKTGGCGSCA